MRGQFRGEDSEPTASPDAREARGAPTLLRSAHDVPVLPIEQVVAQLIDQASDIISTQDRLRT
ncbi:MAG: hypothetical protein ACLGIF_08790, partial [Actinomycetes bacterium]